MELNKPVVTTYKKYNSFENFWSRHSSSISGQRARVIRILEAKATLPSPWAAILGRALTDLKNDVAFKLNQYSSDELAMIEDALVDRYVFHRYRYEIFPQTKELDDFPPYLQIEPSSICNYRCVFCYQTDSEFTKKENGHMGTMTFEMFKNIVDQSVGRVEFISLASRGEPLVCKDIDKMLQYTEGKFLGLKLNTNASLISEKLAHTILSSGISTVVFSADAAKEPLYSQLRVNGKLERVTKNIEMFQTIRAKQYPQKKMITRISGVKINEDQDMAEMEAFWGGIVDQIAFVNYNPWENVYTSPVNQQKTPCSDLWRRMFVWYDGRVNPCDTDYKSSLSMGLMSESGLPELWRSSRYEALREGHLKKLRNLAEPCRRCTVV